MEAERSVLTTCTSLFFAPYIIWLFADISWVWMTCSQTSIQHTCRDCKSGEVWTFGGILLLLVPALLFLHLWPLLLLPMEKSQSFLSQKLHKVYTWLLLLLPQSLLHSSPARSSPPSPWNSFEIIKQCPFFHMASSGLLTWPSLRAY